MSSKNTKLVRDLIIFYVKENYKQYLQEKSLQRIPEEEISGVVDVLYGERKSHLKEFLKKSLKDIMKDDYMGDELWNRHMTGNSSGAKVKPMHGDEKPLARSQRNNDMNMFGEYAAVNRKRKGQVAPTLFEVIKETCSKKLEDHESFYGIWGKPPSISQSGNKQ